MPHKIVPTTPDPYQRLAELWSYLRPWQRALILTSAVFFALPNVVGYSDPPKYHWVGVKAHWV